MIAASHPKSPRPRKERRIVVRSIRRAEPDLKAIAKIIADRLIQDLDDAADRKPAVLPPPGERYY
ncbi:MULTISPECIES: hypothetical protein [Mycobacteroides]|uniref:hypothetical protein n=1 Tax=Mycobacteroides TaxID=670516 RepID=UPI0009A86ACA|nr:MULTISPECIES: hypothetical protein [Mycobacteroides]AWG70725.1 hypothetical protein DDT49_19670 [Mycobacteroides abscessus]MBN7507645.1 hypothetical protein [Mycobacteroides abscessus subsp. massiliense]SKK72052.1 Uncharacterised protein [Mycobacteroides abscessus subsp. massiliense]SKL19362.1 Uncharacterised protein [Mycobacteroides abscessus subsp. massiliense]SKL77528.1 Uncharacterised protein [Mycobacteroides abscessus subsp. massiliense]